MKKLVTILILSACAVGIANGTTSTQPLASLSVEAIASTHQNNTILRAIVGRSEIGHYLAIETVERGLTEGSPDRLIVQQYVELFSQIGYGPARISNLIWSGSSLHFYVSTPRKRFICEVPHVSPKRAQVRCTVARGSRR